jgi:hypothetical protein
VKSLYFFLRGSGHRKIFLPTLPPIGASMSVIRFAPPSQPKPEVWRCRCGKCRDAAASRGDYRPIPKRNVVSLSSWLSEPNKPPVIRIRRVTTSGGPGSPNS